MLNTDFAPWPSFTQEEADKVCAVLLSNKVNYWTGQEGREFEKEFAQFTDCQFAVAVANGTEATQLNPLLPGGLQWPAEIALKK
jgi:dTDP-4-amino-4,6-dideoxygalactose transaminase